MGENGFAREAKLRYRRAWHIGWLAIVCVMLGCEPSLAVEVSNAPVLRIDTGTHTAAINRIAIDPAGRYMVTGSLDKTAREFDLRTGGLIRVLRPPIGFAQEGQLNGIAVSPDGAIIACGGSTGYQWDETDCIYLFNSSDGSVVRRIVGFPNAIVDLAFSPDGRYLAAVGNAGGLRVYASATGALVGEDTAYGNQAHAVAFDPSSTPSMARITTTCYDGFVRCYTLNDAGATLTNKARLMNGKLVHGLAYSPDGKRLAVCYADSMKVDVLSATDLRVESSADTGGLDGTWLGSLAWSRDGEFLYAAGAAHNVSGENIVRRWTAGGRGAARDIVAGRGGLMDLKTLSDGNVAYASGDASIGIINATGAVVSVKAPPTAEFRAAGNAFRVSADGSKVSFGYSMWGKNTATFSVSALSLQGELAPQDVAPPIVNAASWSVTNWLNNAEPRVNGSVIALSPYELSRSLAIAPDRTGFVLGASWNVYDFAADRTLRWRVPSPAATWAVNVSGDGRLAVCGFGDGTIRWYRMSDGRELLALFPHADTKRWVLWTPSGYYACSPGGEDLIGWHINRGKDKAADFFPASRFRSQFYRPEIVERVLTTLDEGSAIREANGASTGSSAASDISRKLPPVITIISPQSGEAVATDTVTVRYTLRTPSGEPSTGIRVLVDGRPISSATRRITVVSEAGQGDSMTVVIPRRDCAISLIAANRFAESEAATVKVFWRNAGAAPTVDALKPKLYILAVGVSAYKDQSIQLTFPAKDATDFVSSMIRQKGQLYSDVTVKSLTNTQATRDGILDGLDWIQKQTTSKDVAMVFFSGHGTTDADQTYYYLPYDFNFDHVRSTGLPDTEIRRTLQSIAGKTIFFVDSCESGNAIGRKGLGGGLTKVINELSSAENGAIVFAASTGKQSALEKPEWGNGAFTKAVVEGLMGQADLLHNGSVTVAELNVYICERVKNLTGGSQSPVIMVPGTVPDFPIAAVR
ncbi:MAG TPA: caspase family protein [Capsulimonadaceae bacterium]|jgi:WD40 repeat protein